MVSSRLALASSTGQPGLSKFSRQVLQVTSHYQKSLRTTGNEAELAQKFRLKGAGWIMRMSILPECLSRLSTVELTSYNVMNFTENTDVKASALVTTANK